MSRRHQWQTIGLVAVLWALPSQAANSVKAGGDSRGVGRGHGRFAACVSYAVKDPYVEGVGFAAFRDLDSFFKHSAQDDTIRVRCAQALG